MKTEQRDDRITAASLAPVENKRVESFGRVLKNRSFLLLWLAQLLSQIIFNAANFSMTQATAAEFGMSIGTFGGEI